MSFPHSLQTPQLKTSRENFTQNKTFWSDDKIPPLVSITSVKQKNNQERISLQSLNHSEVRSIYTVDKDDGERNISEMLNRSLPTQNLQNNLKNNPKPILTANQKQEKLFQTPILKKNLDISIKQEAKTPISKLRDLKQYQQKECLAIKLYRSLVEDEMLPSDEHQTQFEFDWIKSKNSTELLANVLTNESRLRLYIHYLLQKMHNNEKNRIINEIHKENIKAYDSSLKQVYESIISLLVSLTRKKDIIGSNGQNLQVSVFKNGINIDIDPFSTDEKRKNGEVIRQLRRQINQIQTETIEKGKSYQQIIVNYETILTNIGRISQPEPESSRPLLKESRIDLQVQEVQEEMIRKKNHTFGMKPVSIRSSKQ